MWDKPGLVTSWRGPIYFDVCLVPRKTVLESVPFGLLEPRGYTRAANRSASPLGTPSLRPLLLVGA
jgi:hypothetical protein